MYAHGNILFVHPQIIADVLISSKHLFLHLFDELQDEHGLRAKRTCATSLSALQRHSLLFGDWYMEEEYEEEANGYSPYLRGQNRHMSHN
jgi:hypothetical protein